MSLKSGWRAAKVINADAMQVYKGLDIITNKVTESEQQGIPHLLIGSKQPGEQYVVGEWVQDAIKLVRIFAIGVIFQRRRFLPDRPNA